MGGRGRSRTQRKHFRESRENVWKRSKSDSQQDDGDNNNAAPNDSDNNNNNNSRHWEPFATQNPTFDDYYKEQGIVSQEEWDTFIQFLRKPLPAAFRINSSSQFSADILSQLENDFMKSLQVEATEEVEVNAIRPLPWYPDNLAWHSNFSRMQLRKNQTLERFHEFLKLENEIGNITRQEAVSMVPPLFLDVSPDHFVLDMCAAPGSKTFQLLEMIYQSTTTGSLPSGMVIANDVDVQRCNLLIHQTKRMCTANLMVTNHEAQHFPSCHLIKNFANASENDVAKELNVSKISFDRVLCDVPCSGDGTLRKAPDIWRKWNPGMGNGLHGLQVLIAMRGLSLLNIGGRMVYSTCSMNPVENEAVVGEILRRCGGSVELIDVSNEIPQLVRRPGLKKWKVKDKGMWFTSYKDVPKYRRGGIVPSMFPSGNSDVDVSVSDNDTGSGEGHENGHNEASENELPRKQDSIVAPDASAEEVSTLPLERCMRIVPHDQNTGSFFIAVFHKLAPLPVIQKKSSGSHGQLDHKINQQGELSNALKVDVNTTEVSPMDVPEATLEADLLGDEVEGTPSVADGSEMSEANEPEAVANESEATEIPNGVKTVPETVRGKRKLQMQGKWRGVDPVVFFKEDTIINGIKAFYGIDDSFPFSGHLVTRNSDTNHVKRIYYISKSVKDVLELNEQSGQPLKITSVGLKMFERQTAKEGTSPCAFRISSEGLPLLLPHITKQILSASLVDFKHLLQYKTIKFADFVDAEFGEKASNLMLGCCVVVLKKDTSNVSDLPPHVDASTIAIGCWRGRTNIAVMVTALDCQELLDRLLVRMGTDKDSAEANSTAIEANEVVGLGDQSNQDEKTMELETVG